MAQGVEIDVVRLRGDGSGMVQSRRAHQAIVWPLIVSLCVDSTVLEVWSRSNCNVLCVLSVSMYVHM